MGFIFPESNTESQDIEHVLLLSVNASKTNNNSVIQCQYMPHTSGYNFENHLVIQSRTASVLVVHNDIELSSSLSALNTSVLFKGDGTPVLMEVFLQLPGSLCGLQPILSFIHCYLRVENT